VNFHFFLFLRKYIATLLPVINMAALTWMFSCNKISLPLSLSPPHFSFFPSSLPH
jgi:hypothetical protein